MPKSKEFLTIRQAAALLDVSPNTIRNWDRDAKIPVYRHPMSNYRLFKRKDLEAVLRGIEQSGKLPSGWSRTSRPKRKAK